MSAISDLKDKVATQETALDSISTSVTGIQKDVKFLKDKLTNVEGGATAAEVAELAALVGRVSGKIDAIGTTTASLDAETDSEETPPPPPPVE